MGKGEGDEDDRLIVRDGRRIRKSALYIRSATAGPHRARRFHRC